MVSLVEEHPPVVETKKKKKKNKRKYEEIENNKPAEVLMFQKTMTRK